MEAARLRDHDSGAVLVLALVFMVAASLLVIPLAGYAITNLGNTANLSVTRDVQTAADSIMDDAIEAVRYSTNQGYPNFTSPPGTCSVTVPTLTEGDGSTKYPIQVTCEGYPLSTSSIPASCISNPTTEPGCAFNDSTASREVAFTAQYGAGNIIQAVVEYWDFYDVTSGTCPSNGVSAPTTCPQVGYADRIVSWTVTPANA